MGTQTILDQPAEEKGMQKKRKREKKVIICALTGVSGDDAT